MEGAKKMRKWAAVVRGWRRRWGGIIGAVAALLLIPAEIGAQLNTTFVLLVEAESNLAALLKTRNTRECSKQSQTTALNDEPASKGGR
jgi:gas vesicle protein